MASIKPTTTIREYQDFVRQVYGLHNDRYFDTTDMLTNVQRFAMRGIKGIRVQDKEKIKLNLLIAESWFMSLMNQLRIDLEESVWNRFPYHCSYCGRCPCCCREKKIRKRMRIRSQGKKRPKTFAQFQKMFADIYSPSRRTLEGAGIHLAEELGELSEAFLKYRGERNEKDFGKVKKEAADFFSCLMGVFNSLNVSVPKELSRLFRKNCHACRKAPCECSFSFVMNFKS